MYTCVSAYEYVLHWFQTFMNNKHTIFLFCKFYLLVQGKWMLVTRDCVDQLVY